MPIRILIIEDSEDDALLLASCFKRAGYQLDYRRADTAERMHAFLEDGNWDLVLSDFSMPTFSATEALKVLQAMGLDLPFIIVSGVIDEETAIAAMRQGAHDYLSKDKLDRLIPAVERELREARNRLERRLALDAFRENEARFRALVANIPGMVFQLVRTADDRFHFSYVSDGCAAVLEVKPADLLVDSRLFFDAIEPRDRELLESALTASRDGHTQVNWDGRIRAPAGDTKWINLRSAPRVLETGATQWEGIISNITKSKHTERQLRQSRAKLAELSSHLEAAKEEERERIARDIHDELGGMLVAIKFEASLLANRALHDAEQLRRRVAAIQALTDQAISTASRVARELRPGILKDFGLAAAVECQADDFAQRTGITCDKRGICHDVVADDEASLALFRIFQEALTNIAKHAQADRVAVLLQNDGDELLLEIADNGKGIRPEDLSKPKSFGLRGIQERMRTLGGLLEIGRSDLGGACLRLHAPRHRTAACGQSAADTLQD